MAKSKKQNTLPEWASQIMALRRRLKMSQGELARRMECSAMSVSRWERGLQAPTADYYIPLGKLAGKEHSWLFWEHAGLQMADVARTLPGEKDRGPLTVAPELEKASAGSGARAVSAGKPRMVALPLLSAVAGTHGNPGARKHSLDRIPSSKLLGVPEDWCANSQYTSLLRARGHSMEPLIRNGDILAVDSFQTDKAELNDKIVVATHEEHGLCVSHLRRYGDVELLESENHEYESVVLGNKSGWHIVGKVLWWISAAP